MHSEEQDIYSAAKNSGLKKIGELVFETDKPYRGCLAVFKALKSAGWTSGFPCQGEKGGYHITLFPPGQKQESRGMLLGQNGGARRYTVYMRKP